MPTITTRVYTTEAGNHDRVIELVEVQPSDWVKPEFWPAPYFAQKGEQRCLVYGLGAQCQRPLDHDGDHAHQGLAPDGQVWSSGWSNWR